MTNYTVKVGGGGGVEGGENSSKPTMHHRDLKSPNLFVMTNYTVKVRARGGGCAEGGYVQPVLFGTLRERFTRY
jgi:hypothetical protein